MEEKDKQSELTLTRADYAASGVRGAANLIPIVGAFLAEIVGIHIPNQRMDRIAKFATELERRMNSVERELFKNRIDDEEFSELIAEGFSQSAHSLSDERRSYIASLIIHSLTSDQISHIESRHLLRILGEINDVEVIWLRFYRQGTITGDEKFRETHKKVLEPVDDL